MNATRIFLGGCLLQYRAMFNWATPVGYLAYKVISPLIQILFYVQLGIFATGRANTAYFAVGNALQLTAVNGIFGVIMTVGNERQYGTLPMLLASPANRLATFLGRALFHVLDGITGVALGFAMVALIYGFDLHRANLPLLALCVLLISCTTAGFGLLLGSLSLVARDVIAIGNTFYYGLLVVCGVNFPVERLPGALQLVSWSLPLTRGVVAARRAVAGGSMADVSGLLLAEAGIGALYVTAGYLLFRWLERVSRRGGLQEAY